MAQWIMRLTTDQKIPGSNPGTLDLLFGSFISCKSKPTVYTRYIVHLGLYNVINKLTLCTCRCVAGN